MPAIPTLPTIPTIPTIFVSLGSNINPAENLQAATAALRTEFPDITFSSIYQTAAMYEEEQDDFLNAVARFETEASPEVVFDKLKKIEADLEKNKKTEFGPRTIDLDFLLYGDGEICNDRITIPHAGMHERRFVLEPLCELIDQEGLHPVLGKTWKKLLDEVGEQKCEKFYDCA